MLPHGVHAGSKKVHAEGTYQAQMIVHGPQVVYDHAFILAFLSTPGAKGVATSPM